MAKQFDEKLKILYILKILTEETDADAGRRRHEKARDGGSQKAGKVVYGGIESYVAGLIGLGDPHIGEIGKDECDARGEEIGGNS